MVLFCECHLTMDLWEGLKPVNTMNQKHVTIKCEARWSLTKCWLDPRNIGSMIDDNSLVYCMIVSLSYMYPLLLDHDQYCQELHNKHNPPTNQVYLEGTHMWPGLYKMEVCVCVYVWMMHKSKKASLLSALFNVAY